MNWLSNVLVLWAYISALDDSWGSVVLDQKLRHVSLVLHAKCTYSYEVAVHTVRGSQFYSKRLIPNSCSGKFVCLQISFLVFGYFRGDIVRV